MSENHDWIVLSHTPLLKTFGRAVITSASVISIIGTGWYLGSSAMQWAGFGLLALIAIANGVNPPKSKTPQQAADYLFKKYGVNGVTAASIQFAPTPEGSENE